MGGRKDDKLTQLLFCDLSTPKGRPKADKVAKAGGSAINGVELHALEDAVGTIMENSKLSLVKWFLALFFMAQNKNSISSVALAKDLGITQASA